MALRKDQYISVWVRTSIRPAEAMNTIFSVTRLGNVAANAAATPPPYTVLHVRELVDYGTRE